MLVYEDVFKALNRARIKYIVAGGVAVVLHGFPRYTGDLDLMVYLEKGNLGRFFDALGKLGFLPKVPVRREEFQDERMRERWRTEKNMVVFSFQNRKAPFRLVDMFVDEPIRFPDVERKAVRVRYGTTRIPLMAIEHLVLLKDAAGRGKDL
ncbi:MAG: hypothetical protein GX606_07670, partial [Elusimicrobia bacterium]|nr:hypothetical protein [Elusimicrobiota bacterium]